MNAPDRFAAARSVADAVLYEGYVLYPYRASAAKNQMRWQFGVLAPRRQVEFDATDRWYARTECVVAPGAEPVLRAHIRCLQVQRRTVEAAGHAPDEWIPVDALSVDGAKVVPWDEATEHEIDLGGVALIPPAAASREVRVSLPGGDDIDELRDGSGAVVGRAIRRREPVDAVVRVETEWAGTTDVLLRVLVTIENETNWSEATPTRDEVVRRSLVAVHTLLAIDDGVFVSLLDPPDDARDAVAGCINEGTFPVLIGDDDTAVLSSPIILYDHPEVAPESPGDLYDATEIDEILALRVITLTDDEKAEARGTDARAAAIIDRCDDMPPEVWARLHGAMRSLHPDEAEATTGRDRDGGVPWWDPAVDEAVDPGNDTVRVGDVDVGTGTRVRLRPSRRADAHDLFLAGMDATVAGVFHDVDGEVHVAVTIDDDPATEELAWQGRYLYFHPDEIQLRVESDVDR
ncbi:MAG: hypothetical protein JWL83_2320 [Actinomycetia bacterium]|nr:hypothetical protein [Actinomycetes bacterium]